MSELFAHLSGELYRTVADLSAHHAAQILCRPEITGKPYAAQGPDPTFIRLRAEIRAIGEKMFALDGVVAMNAAYVGFDSDPVAGALVAKCWDGIAGEWWA